MVEAETKKSPEEARMSNLRKDQEKVTSSADSLNSSGTSHAPPGQNKTSGNSEDVHCQVLDELYQSITSENDNTKLQEVLLSSSYPSPISLKLQSVQRILKAKGLMDIDSLNFAIRKLRREETTDINSANSGSLIWKYYISADFTRYAISNEGAQSDLETCVRNDFVDHHNAFGQDNDLSGHSKSELCIPVVHHGYWCLYAFNISDQKLSILDPTPKRKHHKSTRLKICRALEFVKDKFDLFRNTSDNFSSWRYEFTNLNQLKDRKDEDSGFFVFNFMRHWDGHQLHDQRPIPCESEKLRKHFLEFIVSFNYNEVYQPDAHISQLIEKLRSGTADGNASGSAWRRCKMDSGMLEALRENDLDGFSDLFKTNSNTTLHNLCRGATCDGDGVLHIAARCGELELLCAIFRKVDIELNLAAIDRRLDIELNLAAIDRPPLEGSVRDVCVTIKSSRQEHQQKVAELLRSRNHKGDTCLHEAIRRGDVRLALSLILADEELNNGNTSAPPLVQRADYQGISPLYLATTFCRSDIVRILTHKDRKDLAPFSGPGGKTAMHVAVLLNKELTEQLLEWNKKVTGLPDLKGMADKSGNTPLHLVASVGEPAIAKIGWRGTHLCCSQEGLQRLVAHTCCSRKRETPSC